MDIWEEFCGSPVFQCVIAALLNYTRLIKLYKDTSLSLYMYMCCHLNENTRSTLQGTLKEIMST